MTLAPGAPHSTTRHQVTALTAETVTALQSMCAYPSISILVTTRPGRTLHEEDLVTLRRLSAQVDTRLAEEGITEREDLLDALESLIAQSAQAPTDRAVALFVSPSHRCRIALPVAVADRCVVDPTFATRDLVRALQHSPRHTALLLSSDEARLLYGHGASLSPVPSSAFPAHRRTDGRRGDRGAETLTEFLRRVDRALGAALRLNPMPLVLVAAEPTATRFLRLSRNTGRLAGSVRGNYLKTPASTLRDLIRPVLREYLLTRGQEALELIERRADDERVLRDINTAWLAARWERPEMLAVEEDYFYPARLGPDGDTLIPADDVDHPEVIDDAVDELIEIVLSRGGWVALLAPGQLPEGTHLALTLRHR
jgi:broad specificity phosphatase PhoE